MLIKIDKRNEANTIRIEADEDEVIIVKPKTLPSFNKKDWSMESTAFDVQIIKLK